MKEDTYGMISSWICLKSHDTICDSNDFFVQYPAYFQNGLMIF